ncbi:diguanylate cyclase [Sulfurimonas autotrophica DSM 16294]|uniref:Diguanylate cyclase n=2 Tax=Sulfurimonas autotrophica TaxID=202747 RepID=E0URJ3_SULAO|nr:diguanylate cyclase [Sulfurimonas autotrophica DSM 16294]
MLITNQDVSNLLKFSKEIEKNIVLIATRGIKVDTVEAIFERRKISAKKFRDSYGIPIIEYFLAVVEGEKPLGACPFMSKLVHFLMQKGITPREVFDICMGLRKSLVAFLLRKDIANPALLMDEMAMVFDANLSGVLESFTDLYDKMQENLEHAKMKNKRWQQTSQIINAINTKIIIVEDGRIILANKTFLEMLNVDNLKELYQKHTNVFYFLEGVDVYEDEYQKNIQQWIEKVHQSNKTFKTKIYNQKLKKGFVFSGNITTMQMHQTTQYIITLNNISKYILDEKILKDMLTHDELTGFRNYATFEKLLGKIIQRAQRNDIKLFLAIADIPELREINENKGRNRGDMVICEVAEDLRYLVDSHIYLARLEGSRFGILIQYENEQTAYDWCVKLFNKMEQRAEKKTLAITEVDATESISKLMVRAYALIDQANTIEDSFVLHDFQDIIEYNKLPLQSQFTDKLSKLNSIEITVFYKELPLVSNAKILSVSDERINVKLSLKQIKAVQNDMIIYFKLTLFDTVKASIQSIDIDNQTVWIDRFRFDKHSPLRRKLYRIEADKNIKAYLAAGEREDDVEVLNMNIQYIAVKIGRKRSLDINSQVYLEMQLPLRDVFKQFSSNCTVTRIEKILGGYKLVLLCHLNNENQDMLSHYIANHQRDIIHDLQL